METGQPYPFKGFWIRFVATLIDAIILTIGLIFFAGFTFLFFGSTFGAAAAFSVLFLIIFGAIILILIYKPLMEASDYQATFGKSILGMKVVDQNGQKITMTSSFLRTILHIIGAQAFLLCLGVVMIGFTEYKQGLHDILANTYVVTTHWEGPVPLEDNFGA